MVFFVMRDREKKKNDKISNFRRDFLFFFFFSFVFNPKKPQWKLHIFIVLFMHIYNIYKVNWWQLITLNLKWSHQSLCALPLVCITLSPHHINRMLLIKGEKERERVYVCALLSALLECCLFCMNMIRVCVIKYNKSVSSFNHLLMVYNRVSSWMVVV